MGVIVKKVVISTIILLVSTLFTSVPFTMADTKHSVCDGKYKGVMLASEELQKILADYAELYPEGVHESDSLRVNLCGVNLCDTDLSGFNLSKIDLRNSNMSRTNLKNALLVGAQLQSANLRGSELSWANLSGAKLSGAKLIEVFSMNADLGKVSLRDADLSDARFIDVNLSMADLWGADLSRASLKDVDMSGTRLWIANLDSVNFELKSGTLPIISDFVSVKNLSRIRYGKSPHSLIELREAFRKAGMRQ